MADAKNTKDETSAQPCAVAPGEPTDDQETNADYSVEETNAKVVKSA